MDWKFKSFAFWFSPLLPLLVLQTSHPHSIFPSLINKTSRYLNSFAWREQSTVWTSDHCCIFICTISRVNKRQAGDRKWNINPHTSLPGSPEDSCPVSSPAPSKRCRKLPGNLERSRYPSARRAANKKHDVNVDTHQLSIKQHPRRRRCLVPQADYLPPARPRVDVRASPGSGRRSLRRTCW